MSSFGDLYGGLSLMFNSITLVSLVFLFVKLRSYPMILFLTRMFTDGKRFRIAFIFLWLTAIFVVVGYGVSFFVSFYYPQTLFWEYTNLLAFFCFMMFSVVFSGIYKFYVYNPHYIEKPKLNEEGPLLQNPLE